MLFATLDKSENDAMGKNDNCAIGENVESILDMIPNVTSI